MNRKTFLFLMLLAAMSATAETALIIKPLNGNEHAEALAQIGYVKLTTDSLFVYSHADVLLGKNAIKNISHIRYGETTEPTAVEDVQTSVCRVYPNPTQDMLVVDNADCETAYIFDLSGYLLQTVTLTGDHASINVTAFPQGEYLLLLSTQTYKFIKQ